MTRASHEKILDIAAQLLSGMPSELSKTMSDDEAAQWAIRRATALCDAYCKTIPEKDMQT